MGSADIGAHSHHRGSNLHFPQQKQTWQESLPIDAFPLRINNLFIDGAFIAWWSFHKIRIPTQAHRETVDREDHAQFHWPSHLHPRCFHHLPWHQPIMEQLFRLLHQADHLRFAFHYNFVRHHQEFHTFRFACFKCLKPFQLVTNFLEFIHLTIISQLIQSAQNKSHLKPINYEKETQLTIVLKLEILKKIKLIFCMAKDKI